MKQLLAYKVVVVVNNTLVGRYEVPPPHNVSLAKGLISIAATWDFVNFTIHSIIGKQFLEWVSPTICPEETFFATLNFNPQIGAPGAFTGKRYILSDRHWPIKTTISMNLFGA